MKKKLAPVLVFIMVIAHVCNGEGKDIHYFIEKAWGYSSTVKQAEYDVKKYKNMELEAFSTFTPKVNTMTWLAPMYTIKETDDPSKTETNFDNWGPYYNLDMQFVLPLFAFTRVISGIKAARAGQEVARQDVMLTKWQVAKDVRLYYYGIIFGKTMLKTIKLADDMLSNALNAAEKAYAEGDISVTEVNISQLKYFYTQIPIFRSFAEKSIEQAQEALFITTGERLADEDVPNRLAIDPMELQEFDHYLKLMLEHRPLLKKLNKGIEATRHLMNLEYKSMLPVLFAGGFIKYTAAPTVDMHYNKFLSNSYNTFIGDGRGIDYGFAAGFLWEFDPMKSVAKGLQKKAELDKLIELQNYAMDGFPVQLDVVLKDLRDLRVKVDNLKEAIEHAKSWMFFAANAYALGDGEAKDIMDGLAAFVKAKTDYYQAIYDYNKKLGELCEIVGIDVTKP